MSRNEVRETIVKALETGKLTQKRLVELQSAGLNAKYREGKDVMKLLQEVEHEIACSL